MEKALGILCKTHLWPNSALLKIPKASFMTNKLRFRNSESLDLSQKSSFPKGPINEIYKLRTDMKIGFIEMENQLKSTKEELVSSIQNVSNSMDHLMKGVGNLSSNVERGFLAIEEAMESDVKNIQEELSSIKERLNKANL